MNLQITVQGYKEDGSMDKSEMLTDAFDSLESAKATARVLWAKLESIHRQVFIIDVDLKKNIFYSANFK